MLVLIEVAEEREVCNGAHLARFVDRVELIVL